MDTHELRWIRQRAHMSYLVPLLPLTIYGGGTLIGIVLNIVHRLQGQINPNPWWTGALIYGFGILVSAGTLWMISDIKNARRQLREIGES